MRSRRWIGRAILAIAALHTLFGLTVFAGPVMAMVSDGLFNTVGANPMRAAVSWFLISGFFMPTTGMVIDQMEAAGLQYKLALTGWVLLAITVLGILLMPASGFWLMLVPAIFAIRSGYAR